MGMGGGGKGGGGFMPNPFTGAPRNATPGLPSPNFGGGGNSAPPNQTMPNLIGGPADGRMYAGGNPNFNEAGGNQYDIAQAGDPNAPMKQPFNPQFGGGMMNGAQGGSSPGMLGALLKRWDQNGQGAAQPGVPGQTMTYAPPGASMGSASMPPAGGAPQGVPGMAAGNFGPAGQSGNPQNAIFNAIATGNQAGLAGQGSQATNSDINANQSGGGGNSQNYLDWYNQNQAALNRTGPAYQKGGIFGPK